MATQPRTFFRIASIGAMSLTTMLATAAPAWSAEVIIESTGPAPVETGFTSEGLIVLAIAIVLGLVGAYLHVRRTGLGTSDLTARADWLTARSRRRTTV